MSDPSCTSPRDAVQVLSALGPQVTAETRFPVTIWTQGIYHPEGGQPRSATLPWLVDAILLHRAGEVVTNKGDGWFFCPTSTTDGYKQLASVLTISCLVLDCDSGGSWDQTLAELEAIGLAYVAYETGGHRPPEKHKWRVVIPFDREVDVSTVAAQTRWKSVYHFARQVFGALGGLTGVGFDGNVSCCTTAWYLTERRFNGGGWHMPARRVVYRLGHSLSWDRFEAQVPPEPPRPPRVSTPRPEPLPPDEERNELLVGAMIEHFDVLTQGRRDLLPQLVSALLDFGLAPDDVASIIDDLWAAMPADARKAAHRYAAWILDQLENDSWEPSAGALRKNWRQFADAIATIIPDEVEASFQRWSEAQEARDQVWFDALLANYKKKAESEKPVIPALPRRNNELTSEMAASICGSLPEEAPWTGPRPKPKNNDLRKRARVIVKENSTRAKNRDAAIYLGRLLDGEPVAAGGIDKAVAQAVDLLGWGMPTNVFWAEIWNCVLHEPLRNNHCDLARDATHVKVLEEVYKAAQARRKKWDLGAPERAAKREHESILAVTKLDALIGADDNE